MSASSIEAFTCMLREVVGDHEQHRRLERGGHRLAHVHVARDHDAVDRGRDDRVLEVHLGLVHARLRLGHRGLVRLELGRRRRRSWPCAVSRSLCGQQLLGGQLLRPLVLLRVSSTRGLRPVDVGARGDAGWPGPGRRRASKSDGSSRAMTWPFLTVELKSACRLWIVPETCEPTWTVVTACSVAGGAHHLDDVAAVDGCRSCSGPGRGRARRQRATARRARARRARSERASSAAGFIVLPV